MHTPAVYHVSKYCMLHLFVIPHQVASGQMVLVNQLRVNVTSVGLAMEPACLPWMGLLGVRQSHRAYDRKMLDSWENRRKNIRLVAEGVGDRQGKISRSKVVDGWSYSKLLTCDSKSFGVRIDRMIGRRSQRLIVRSVARCYDWSCDRFSPHDWS